MKGFKYKLYILCIPIVHNKCFYMFNDFFLNVWDICLIKDLRPVSELKNVKVENFSRSLEFLRILINSKVENFHLLYDS